MTEPRDPSGRQDIPDDRQNVGMDHGSCVFMNLVGHAKQYKGKGVEGGGGGDIGVQF